MIFLVLCMLILMGLAFVFLRKFDCVRNLVRKIWRIIFWNTFIRSILETSIEIIIASMIKTLTFSTEDFYQGFSSIYSYFTLVLIGLIAILVPIFLTQNQANLRHKQWNAKFGSLILNHKTKVEEFAPKLYTTFFLARRLVLGALIVYAGKQTYFQFSVLTFISSLQVIYIGIS